MKQNIIKQLLIFTLVITGCKKSNILETELPLPENTKGVYILNEGNFMKSNASLSYFIPDSQKVYQDVYYSANNRALGDAANDIVINQNRAYIVVNNSHKIEVVSTETNKSLGTIQLPNKSPRRIVIYNSNLGYVSNWNDNSITVFNPTTLEIIKNTITVGNQPEGMAIANGKIYVCNSGWGSDSTISVINTTTNEVVKKINVGKQPYDIAVDSDGEIIVKCSGYSDWSNPSNDLPGGIFVINSTSDSVVSKTILSLQTFGHPDKMAVSQGGFALLKVLNGILKFDTKSNQIINQNYISNLSAYGIGIDDAKQKIYVTDPKNYTVNGKVYIYEFSGALRDSITAGLIPSVIAFKR
ncbi:MAG: YncE family protein [Bacteroidota bacterium]|mgnify:CR=1 FL=1